MSKNKAQMAKIRHEMETHHNHILSFRDGRDQFGNLIISKGTLIRYNQHPTLDRLGRSIGFRDEVWLQMETSRFPTKVGMDGLTGCVTCG